MKHHGPGLDVTLNKYNALWKDMLREWGKNGVKRDAYVPPELSIEGLYKLDVDQDIWQNVDMEDFEGGKVPLWLSDKEVWDGIQAAQEVKSCQQELSQCEWEHSNLHVWLLKDYEAVCQVFEFSKGMYYRFKSNLSKLTELSTPKDDEVVFFALL